MDLHLPIVVEEVEEHCRSISNEKMSELKEKLDALKKTLVKDSIAITEHNNASIIGCPTKLLEFGTDQIQQVIDNAEHIFSISDVLKHVDIWQRNHAVSVLKIFESTFNDVEGLMRDSDSDEDYFEDGNHEWVEMVNDQSIMDLIDQSEWEVESMLEDAPHDNVDNDAAYPEFLDSVIGDINIA